MKRFLILPALVALMSLNPIGAWAQQPTSMTPGQVARLPFSNGLPLGGSLYVSGHLGVDPAVGKPSDDPEEEAKKVLDSVEATLKQNGMGMDDLVYVEIFCTDLKLYTAFNKVYGPMFHKAYPARAFIGVKELLFGAHFKVMGIAVKHAAKTKK